MDQLTAYQFEIFFSFSVVIIGLILVFDIIVLVKFIFHYISVRRNIVPPLKPLSNQKFTGKYARALEINYLIRKHFLSILNITLLPFTLFFIYNLVSPLPRVVEAYPNNNDIYATYTKPITITFNVPIQKNKIEAFLNPEITGKWNYDGYSHYLPWTRKITFTPTHSLPLDQKIMVYLSYIANEFHTEAGNEYYLEFQSAALPKITTTYPEDKSTDIPTDAKVAFTLDAIDTKETSWRFEIIPTVEYSIIRTDSEELFIFFKDPLTQGSSYTAKLFQTPLILDLATDEVIEKGEEKLAKELTFETVKAPLVQSITPNGTTVFIDSPIALTFDTPMIPETVENNLIISPNISPTYTWNDLNTELIISRPENLKYNTTYEIILGKGTESELGGILEEPVAYSFKTIGPIEVLSVSPAPNSTGASISSVITIKFDQEVDRTSAEEKFSFTPATNGAISWYGNTMTFTPNTLNYSTTYTYNLNAGVKSVHGQPSETQITGNFTTGSQVKLLSVPLYSQQESYTCNISATGMMLAYRGVYISEADIKAAIGTNGARGSGNPHVGFVENYGTYWEPIVAFVRRYRTATVFTNWNLTALLNEVEKGNPVMVWGQNGWSSPTDISWTASDGTYIYAISGMHSYIVKGFVGDKANPSSIIINDPWRGEIYMTPSVFNYRWSFFKTAMVVY